MKLTFKVFATIRPMCAIRPGIRVQPFRLQDTVHVPVSVLYSYRVVLNYPKILAGGKSITQ